MAGFGRRSASPSPCAAPSSSSLSTPEAGVKSSSPDITCALKALPAASRSNTRSGSPRTPGLSSCLPRKHPQRQSASMSFSGQNHPLSLVHRQQAAAGVSSSSASSVSAESPNVKRKAARETFQVNSSATAPSPYHVSVESGPPTRRGDQALSQAGGPRSSKAITASTKLSQERAGTKEETREEVGREKGEPAEAGDPKLCSSVSTACQGVTASNSSSTSSPDEFLETPDTHDSSTRSSHITFPEGKTRTVGEHGSSFPSLPRRSFSSRGGPSGETPRSQCGSGATEAIGSSAGLQRTTGREEDEDSFVVVEAVDGRDEVPGCVLSPSPLRFPSHCFSADGLWDSEGPPTEADFTVSVSDPETRSISGLLGRFTLYLVSGHTSCGVAFNARKRYSDFEWLRQQLVLAFPGVFVPPLPRKQKLGRFDTLFVESRRQGLQEFLQRMFTRRHLAQSSVFLGWLVEGTETGAFDQFKKDVASRSVAAQLAEFQEIFRDQLEGEGKGASRCNTRAQSDRFIVFKQFLSKQLSTLQDLHKHFARLASLNCSGFTCVSTLQGLLREVCSIEEHLLRQLPDLPIPAARSDLASTMSLQRACLLASPAHNYDVMQQVVGKEFDDTECMLEAVAGLERLVQMKQQTQAQITREENSLRHVLRSTRGRWLQTLVHRKDKETQVADIRASLEALKSQVQALEQWSDAARVVWISLEMPKLVTAKNIAFSRAVNAFVDRQQQQTLQEARVWQAFRLRAVPSPRVAKASSTTTSGEQVSGTTVAGGA